MSTVMPCTMYRSRWKMPVRIRLPIPGMANRYSMTTTPAISEPMERAITVTSVRMLGRRPCRKRMNRLVNPFARAERT